MYIEVPLQVQRIADILEKKYGAVSVIFGGYVLQQVAKKLKNKNELKHPLRLSDLPGDVDLLTSATPDQIQAVFPDCKPYTHLKKLNIFACKVERDNLPIDIVYNPDITHTEGLIEAARRCFCSIKSMQATIAGEVLDPLNAMHDLKEGVIKINGSDQLKSLENTPHNIFFIIDTAVKIGLIIPDDIKNVIKTNVSLLRNLDSGMLDFWMNRLWRPGCVHTVFAMLHELSITTILFPTIYNAFNTYSDWFLSELELLDAMEISPDSKQQTLAQFQLSVIICAFAYDHQELNSEELNIYLKNNKEEVIHKYYQQIFVFNHTGSIVPPNNIHLLREKFQKTVERFIQ